MWLLQLIGVILLFVAGFELWRLLVDCFFTLIMKTNLLRNIPIDPHTKISVVAAGMSISLWTQLWKFFRAPKQEKLFILTLSNVKLLVVTSNSEKVQLPVSTSPPFWQSLDTTASLKDIGHPMWKGVRVWIPRLVFLCRCIHAIELGVSSITVDVVQKNKNSVTPVLNIQRGSVYVSAMFHVKTMELSCTIILSRDQSMVLTIPELDATVALGHTEVCIRVPISHNHEDIRAPVPSSYSVSIDLIQANFGLEHLVQAALSPKQQKHDNDPRVLSNTLADDSDATGGVVGIDIHHVLTVLRIAEILPNDLHCEVHKLEVNIVDKVMSRGLGSVCTLGLNGFKIALSDSNDELGTIGGLITEYPVVVRKADLAVGPLVVRLHDVDDTSNVPPVVKLDGLKLTAEGTLSADTSHPDMSDEVDEDDIQHLALRSRSTISGESRGLIVMISKRIEPLVASCCTVYDRAAINIQERLPTQSLAEDAHQVERWSVMDYCDIELDAQFKLMKTEITLISLDRTCDVLPGGVPSISLSLGEVGVYAHPLVNEDHLGVRAKADIQCSRLKVSFFMDNDLVKCPFLSLDYVRVFISPVPTIMQSEVPAQVEMEAEWVEAKWAPEVLHAIGGALELGIFTLSSFLHESRYSDTENIDTRSDSSGWKTSSCLKVPPMRKMVDVTQDVASPGEMVVFRCIAKRICVTFPYNYDGQRRIDCISVDTFTVSSEETTGRLRISILDARAFPSRASGEIPSISAANTSHKQTQFRRKTFASRALRSRTIKTGVVHGHDSVYFVADCFSLEENPVVGSSKTVVDLFAKGVRLEWDISTQLRIMELIRRITFSSWEMIYRARSAYAIHCTPSDSIYNRAYGLNPPLDDIDECLRYERQFLDLISASGDKLHRLHATNLSVNAKLCDEVGVHLTVGVFAGDDLPEVWVFEDISLKVNEIEMAAVGAVHVRHTMNKQSDYVFGEFEDMLRKRLSACKRSTIALDQTLKGGMLVEITKLHLCTSHDFPLQSYAEAVQRSFDPYKEQLASAVSSYWRPQQELFYQFFLRTPVASHQMELWLGLESVSIECLGNPLESWLERMYPVWIAELAEQELRAGMLDDHVSTLNLTNADLLCDDTYKEMKTLLAEKNARLYIQKVKRLIHETSDDIGSLISVGVGHLAMDVSFEDDITDSWPIIKELDEATEALEKAFNATGRDFAQFTPTCPLFVGVQVKSVVNDLVVRMRRFPTPLMTCDCLGVEGQAFLTAFSSGSDDMSFDLMAAVRCFVNLSIDVVSPVLYFNPGYLYALDELSGLALGFLPLVILDIDKRYRTSVVDIARRLLHGKVSITIKDAGVRLIRAATSFESADFLEIIVHRVRVGYSSGSIDIEVTRVAAKVDPGSLSDVAELSHLKLQVWLKWDCLGDPAMHHIYPIEFVGAKTTGAVGNRFVLQLPDQADASSSEFSTNVFQAFQATKLCVYINGRICPADPENGDPNSNDGWSKRDMASRTAVVLYSRSVEWLIGFGHIYSKIPQYPLPRCRTGAGIKLALPSTDILSILEGVTIEEFDLIGLDVALYASEKHPIGVRAFIDDKISVSGAILKSSHGVFRSTETKDVDLNGGSTTVRRLSFPVEESTWIVHEVNVDAREIQVRVCTPVSGSRGEPLVSIKHVALIVGGGNERVPTHDDGFMKLHSPPPMKRVANAQPFSFPQPSSSEDVKERSKQSILEFFHIPHENPFSYRESDSDTEGELDVCEPSGIEKEVEPYQNEVLDEFRRAGFLLGLFSKEVRVTVTMVALESLVDIADNWVQVIATSLPELFSDAAETAVLLERNENLTGESDIVVDESDSSPKKFTSLAQDPKFSGICLQGGADSPASPDNRQQFEPTPYSNADTVRPIRKKSGKVPNQIEMTRTKEDITLPSPTSSKLVQAFIMVKFEDCQISVQDQVHKGSVLLALNAGTLQHAVSSDSSHERIDLNVDGFQAFTAPLDVDVKSHAIWLKALPDGSYCPRSYGLLRQVIAPIPAQVTIWIDREKVLVKNRVKLDIPVIEVQVNLLSKGILEKLITTATELINTKLAEKKSQDHSLLLQSYMKEAQRQKHSLRQLVALKKQLKWKIAALEWRQLRGWEYRMNERAMAAISTTESIRSLPFEIDSLFQRRKMSLASVSSISVLGSTVTNRYEDEHFTDELQQMTQQYESLSELICYMASEIQKQLKPSPSPNVDMEFVLDRASLTLSGENVDIVRTHVGSLSFTMQLFEDLSGKFALTLHDLSVNNLSPGTPYPDMLLPVYSRSWEGDDMFLRVDAEIAKPVGGITVVQHFEVNVHPIQVCITQEVILQLVAFFSPRNTANTTKEEQREEVRSQFLKARTASNSSSDGRVGSAIIKAVKVAGKAAAHPLSIGRTHRGDSDEGFLSGRKAKGGRLHHTQEDPSQWIAKLANLSESSESPFYGLSDEAEQHRTETSEREISETKDRAKNSILFKRIRLGAVEIVLTYKNKKSSVGSSNIPHLQLPHASQPQALEDMRGFEVKTHALVYCDKTCSPMDLLLRIRRDILLDVLSQVGRNFTNIGNFLRDQFDTSRWAAFDALAPLKSLSTTVSSLTAIGPSHTGAVVPLPSVASPNSARTSSASDSKTKDADDASKTSTSTSLRPTELLSEWQTRRNSGLLTDQYDADSSAPSTPTAADSSHPKQVKAKRSLAKLFTRRKSSSSSLPSPSTQ